MKAIGLGRSGAYYKTDDVGLWFNEVEGRDPVPTHVKCLNFHDHLNRGEFVMVPIESMAFIAAPVFDIAQHGYDASYYRYAIYESNNGWHGRGIVILSSHGGGMRGYMLTQLFSIEHWKRLCQVLTPDELWCVVHEMIDAYEAGRDAERKINFQAFADGRLKKQRRGGQYRVYIAPAEAKEGAA